MNFICIESDFRGHQFLKLAGRPFPFNEEDIKDPGHPEVCNMFQNFPVSVNWPRHRGGTFPEKLNNLSSRDNKNSMTRKAD